MLEPLFRCNLSCRGCGKIQYNAEILDRELSAEECLSAVDECDAPVVSITGGEPFLHKALPQITEDLLKKKKFVYLCTNGLLLKKNIEDYSPSPYLTLSIHLDGNRKRHDASVGREGVYDCVVEAIRSAVRKGFRVTVNCTLYEDAAAEEVIGHFDFVMGLGIEGITMSPGFAYPGAPREEIFLDSPGSTRLFRRVFRLGKGHGWKFNHSTLFLDFLSGGRTYHCTPWGNPTRNVLGWQKPCYLLAAGYAPSFKALMEETVWEKYGRDQHPGCRNCMMHSGFEPTAVADALGHPLKAFFVFLRGPGMNGTEGGN
jgi:hopanoid biosynthesis associated radical SAM protein HpnH